jgi:hypothetical protein
MFLLRPNFTSARVSDASVPPKPQAEVERSAEAPAHDLFATQSSARRKTRCFSAHVVWRSSARGRVDHASVQIDQHVKTILHMTRMCVFYYFMIVNPIVMEWMKLSFSAVQ